MARRLSDRDRRRRTHGQNLLADQRTISEAVARFRVKPGDLVVDVGAGRGALTVPLASAGARVIAVESDQRMVKDLTRRLRTTGVDKDVDVVRGDLRDFRFPEPPYRVMSSPPFGLTTALLGRLLDDPDHGPEDAVLLVQWEVALKHVTEPARALRTAAWAPWWCFELGAKVDRRLFRPMPSVDAGWLIVSRRVPPILPTALAAGFADVLRAPWGRASRINQKTRDDEWR